MDTLPLAYDWVLLLDADEVLTPQLTEDRLALQNPRLDGHFIGLQVIFWEKSYGIAVHAFWSSRSSAKGKAILNAAYKIRMPPWPTSKSTSMSW